MPEPVRDAPTVAEIFSAIVGQETQSLIVGCGHAGDGNVHMGIFQPDDEKRAKVRKSLLGHLNSGVTVCLK